MQHWAIVIYTPAAFSLITIIIVNITNQIVIRYCYYLVHHWGRANVVVHCCSRSNGRLREY